MIDNANNNNKPIILAILPNSFLAYLPIFKPTKVKIKLTNENIIIGTMVVMVDRPIPVIKLSILTNIANNIKLIVFIFISFSLSNIMSLNSFKNRNINIIPNNLLGVVFIYSSNLIPIRLPIIGNIR